MLDEGRRAVARHALLLRELHEAAREHLLDRSGSRGYARSETLFLEGAAAESIHIVLKGWVKLCRVSPNGDETVVTVFSKGESFGEAVAFRGVEYPVSAEAVTACETVEIRVDLLRELMRNDPDTAESILAATFVHLHRLVSQLEQLKSRTGAERTARFLLEFCDPRARSAVVTLPYDKTLIAGRLGMKPESLSRAFTRLKDGGVRNSGNHATIDDVELLRRYSEAGVSTGWQES